MTEQARVKGIDAYTFFARFYALRGLAVQLRNSVIANAAASMTLLNTKATGRWEHERRVLQGEFNGKLTVLQLMEELVKAQSEVVKSAELSKNRDDKRGKNIIPDYDLVHTPASQQPVVVAARKLVDDLRTF